jgi:hypothetical protein
VREQLSAVEDRLFSTVFLAMLFTGAAISASLIAMLAGANANADVFAYGRDTAQGLFSVYAMRMAAVFTLSVSTVGLRTSALPRWVSYLGYLMALVLLLVSLAILSVRQPSPGNTVEVDPDADTLAEHPLSEGPAAVRDEHKRGSLA